MEFTGELKRGGMRKSQSLDAIHWLQFETPNPMVQQLLMLPADTIFKVSIEIIPNEQSDKPTSTGEKPAETPGQFKSRTKKAAKAKGK